MDIEKIILDYYVGKLGNEFEVVPVGKYSPADLVVKRGDIYYCLEVKARRGSYDLDFFRKCGFVVETSKLDRLSKRYGVKELTVATVTSDGYVLKGVVRFDSDKMVRKSGRTTDFDNCNKVEKEFYVVKDFSVENVRLVNNKLIDGVM